MRSTIIVAAILCIAVSSQAESMFFMDESAFLSAAGGSLALESFESFVVTSDFASSTIAAPGFTITTSPEANLGIHQNQFLNLHATDGLKYAGWAARPTDPDVAFTFDQPTTTFGVWLTDALDGGLSGAQLLINANNGDGTTVASGSLESGNEIFIGIVSETPFTEVVFTVTEMPAGGDGIGFDEVRFPQAPVPVQATSWGVIKQLYSKELK